MELTPAASPLLVLPLLLEPGPRTLLPRCPLTVIATPPTPGLRSCRDLLSLYSPPLATPFFSVGCYCSLWFLPFPAYTSPYLFHLPFYSSSSLFGDPLGLCRVNAGRGLGPEPALGSLPCLHCSPCTVISISMNVPGSWSAGRDQD